MNALQNSPNSRPLRELHELRDLPAPAKLNLFLHITGRRPDGYHLIQSVFMLIDWCDTVHVGLRPDGEIRRHDVLPLALDAAPPATALPEQDLTVRAALALQRYAACPLGADITLEKRIPTQAGMGGGSSDAATCLLALNRLWGLHLRRSELAQIGLTLGADVPFFLGGQHAWVEGIGEQLTPIELPQANFVVIKPQAGVATADIFRSPALVRDTKTATIQGFAANLEQDSAHGSVWHQFGHNDLQPVAQAICPEIAQCLQWLVDKGLSPRMTGSGSAVFAPMRPGTALTGLPERWTMKVCSNLPAHPLRGWCEG